MGWLVATILFGCFALNVLASVFVLRHQLTPVRLRVLQLVVVWFVPILGAFICLAILGSDSIVGTQGDGFVDGVDAWGAQDGLPQGSPACGCSEIAEHDDGSIT